MTWDVHNIQPNATVNIKNRERLASATAGTIGVMGELQEDAVLDFGP